MITYPEIKYSKGNSFYDDEQIDEEFFLVITDFGELDFHQAQGLVGGRKTSLSISPPMKYILGS